MQGKASHTGPARLPFSQSAEAASLLCVVPAATTRPYLRMAGMHQCFCQISALEPLCSSKYMPNIFMCSEALHIIRYIAA